MNITITKELYTTAQWCKQEGISLSTGFKGSLTRYMRTVCHATGSSTSETAKGLFEADFIEFSYKSWLTLNPIK